ncbi:MAG: hypothetical protein JWM02_2120 [Frankiales bacterium]|nr:hypothetical protein [Frankiales bacterium]
MSRLESDYYTYMGYDPENSRATLMHYVPMFPTGPVLELACGRGEFLELLRDAGVAAEGIDLDEGMVAAARQAGLAVEYADALGGLRSRADDSLQGIFSAHFVEHLQPDDLEAIIQESARVLAPGGVFVAATPNAACLSVMGYDFWRDPTHIRFYEARLLAFFCAKAGLEVVETGGNPRNHPGPPPQTIAAATHVDAGLTADLATAIQRIAPSKHGKNSKNGKNGKAKGDADSPWYTFGHFLSVLEERLRVTQEELAAVRLSYAHLLDQLYPPNEVYVLARAT